MKYNKLIKDAESMRVIQGNLTYSQAHQDLFVRIMTEFKKNGIYCEVGGADPKQSNNTFILERDLDWKGVSIEINPELVNYFNKVRNNPCISGDATTFDYSKYFLNNNFPKQIDYLSLDIDPPHITYKALEKLPLDKYRFSVITYEHEKYSCGDEFMIKSRRFLESFGYFRVVSNVRCCGRDFEDWYIDPTSIPFNLYKKYIQSDIECAEIFKV